MNTKLDKITDRVRKLLVKAERTDNADEAIAFMEAAQELMLRHAIDEAALCDEPMADMIVEAVRYSGLQKWWAPLGRAGSQLIVNAMGLVGMAVDNRRKHVYLYGARADVEHTQRILESVWRQARPRLRAWAEQDVEYQLYKYSAPHLRAAENAYLVGFCNGFAQKFKDAQQTVQKDTAGAELVLRSRKAQVKDFMAGKTARGRASQLKVVGSGYDVGFADGKKIGSAALT